MSKASKKDRFHNRGPAVSDNLIVKGSFQRFLSHTPYHRIIRLHPRKQIGSFNLPTFKQERLRRAAAKKANR